MQLDGSQDGDLGYTEQEPGVRNTNSGLRVSAFMCTVERQHNHACPGLIAVLCLVTVSASLGNSQGLQAPPKLHNPANARDRLLSMNRELEALAGRMSGGLSLDLQAQIKGLLVRRSVALLDAIRINPAAALELTLSPEARQTLDRAGIALDAFVESNGEWRGQMETIVEDDFHAGRSRISHYLTGPDGPLELHFVGDLPEANRGQLVRIEGIRVGEAVAVRVWRAEGSAAGTAAPCNSTGEQRIAVVLVSFPTRPLLSSVTAQQVRDIYFGSAQSVNDFLKEASYQKTWVSGDVIGPVVLDGDYFDQPTVVRDAAIRAASSLVDFRNYSRIALVVPQSSAGLESGGLGSIGCSTIPLSAGGSIVASTTWLGDVSFGSRDHSCPKQQLPERMHRLAVS
jgi:hypothetical protein